MHDRIREIGEFFFHGFFFFPVKICFVRLEDAFFF